MTMHEEAGSGKTNLSSYLQYQASTLTEVSKFHQGGKKTQSPWDSINSSYCYSVILSWPHIFSLLSIFPAPHNRGREVWPWEQCLHLLNGAAEKELSGRNTQIFGIFCQRSHVRIKSAHNRSYVILMSFLLWVTEKNLSALFCYLLRV